MPWKTVLLSISWLFSIVLNKCNFVGKQFKKNETSFAITFQVVTLNFTSTVDLLLNWFGGQVTFVVQDFAYPSFLNSKEKIDS